MSHWPPLWPGVLVQRITDTSLLGAVKDSSNCDRLRCIWWFRFVVRRHPAPATDWVLSLVFSRTNILSMMESVSASMRLSPVNSQFSSSWSRITTKWVRLNRSWTRRLEAFLGAVVSVVVVEARLLMYWLSVYHKSRQKNDVELLFLLRFS